MRFRPRFTIRDILWLIALISMGLAWWVDRSYWHRAERFESLVNETIAKDRFVVKLKSDISMMESAVASAKNQGKLTDGVDKRIEQFKKDLVQIEGSLRQQITRQLLQLDP